MAKTPFYKVESNESQLSDTVISLYNNLKKVSAVEFDDFSRNLIHNIMEQSIPVMDVMLFINFVNEKNAPKQLKDYFGDKINDFFNNKVAVLKLFNDCIEANLRQVPSAESYTVKQVASLLCLNKQTAQILVRNGVIPSFSINSRYRITARDINLFIQANRNRTVKKTEKVKVENTTQKPSETQKEVKTVNNTNTASKTQNKTQNQPIKKNQNVNQTRPKQQPHQNVSNKQEKKKDTSTLPYPTLKKPQQNGILEDIKPKKTPVQDIIINKPDEKPDKPKQKIIKTQTDKEAFDDILEQENQKQELPSIITPSDDDKEDENEDIFGEIKSKEELNVIDSDLPDINILDNKEENKEEVKEENIINNEESKKDNENDNKFNTNIDFVINEENKNNNEESINQENINNEKENKEESYPTLPEQNFILVPENKVIRHTENNQDSDIINTEESNEDKEDSSQKKKLKINYLNKE